MPDNSILSTVTSITTPLALIAFIVAIGLFAFRSHLDSKGRRIERARPEDLPKILKDEDFPFAPEINNLPPKDQKEIVQSQIDARTKRLLIQAVLVFLLAVLLAALAYAFRNPSALENGDSGKNGVLPEVVIDSRKLTSSTEFVYPNQVVRLKGLIYTDGHSLTIKAKTLVVDDAEITTFDPLVANSGSSGLPGKRGVDGTGAGQKGGDGERGGDGMPGEQGRIPGNLLLAANEFSGVLRISANGQSGGTGGDGGAGGNGGSGAQGEASRPGVVDCASGPGHGGTGGNGGDGGNAGSGGNGASGARVSVEVPGRLEGSIKITARAGVGGTGGRPGLAGAAGAGGPEGALQGRCTSAGRVGAAGSSGRPGKSASDGKQGGDGIINIRTATLVRESSGSVSLP